MGAVQGSLEPAATYNRLAPFYDWFTAGWPYDEWISAIEKRAIALGLTGRRALDLACGTGKTTLPLLDRGYRVTACDISDGMIEQARLNYPEHAEAFVVADMRDLPDLGVFDFVLCVDDAINCLRSVRDLKATFAGVRRLLAPRGVFAFSANSLFTYRTYFATASIIVGEDALFAWRGEGPDDFAPGEISSASVDVFTEREDGLWERHSARHVQRHHPAPTVITALEQGGLRCRVTVGQRPGGLMDDSPDEASHTHLVYFVTR